jgi:alpha-galactosidase/6-phospho-beta-glucosidase family protein
MIPVIAREGSLHIPEQVHGLLQNHTSLLVSEICLTEINRDRLDALCGLCYRMAALDGASPGA